MTLRLALLLLSLFIIKEVAVYLIDVAGWVIRTVWVAALIGNVNTVVIVEDVVDVFIEQMNKWVNE